MNDVTRYADMKDSGIWKLEDIPSGWEITKIKYIAKLDPYCDSSNIDDDNDVSFVPMECIKNNNVIERSSKKYKYNSSYSTFFNGDIAIAKVTPCFENGNIVIMKNLINGFGFGSSELFILRPFKVDTKFLFYALQSHSFKEGAVSIMTGTGGLKRVSSTYMKNAFIVMPPEYEQKRISSYLDDQCAKIDDIIAGARTSIEEYKKWKASVIYEAVTKGLDPHAEMKNEKFLASKETSCKWKVTKIKYVAKLDPYSDMSNIPEDIEISFVPMECIKNNKRIEKCSLKNNYNSSYSSFLNGDIVVAKVTPCFENGNIAIMENLKNGCGFGSSELFVLRPFNINTKFLFYYLQSYSFKECAISIMTGTGGLKRVSSTYVKNAIIFIPSEHEQIEISNYLDHKCSEIDHLVSEKEALIADLKSYKKSLIYEVVTGKRKVS